MHRTEMSVPWRFGTNTCTMPPLIYIYIYIYHFFKKSIFSKNALNWSKVRVIPCMGTSPGRRDINVNNSAVQDLLEKNVSKEVCFWLWGKDNLVQLPKEPSVTWTVDAVCFSGEATEFCKCVCLFLSFRWWMFYKQDKFDAGFAHCLILKDGVVPAIKNPGHDSEVQAVSKTASNSCVLLAIGAQVLVTLAPPTACLQ